MTFEEWIAQTDALCTTHLACSWADLCGETEPLRAAFDAGESPVQFVSWWAEKYHLMWIGGGTWSLADLMEFEEELRAQRVIDRRVLDGVELGTDD